MGVQTGIVIFQSFYSTLAKRSKSEAKNRETRPVLYGAQHSTYTSQQGECGLCEERPIVNHG